MRKCSGATWTAVILYHTSSSHFVSFGSNAPLAAIYGNAKQSNAWVVNAYRRVLSFQFKLCGLEPTPDMFAILKETPIRHLSPPPITIPSTSSMAPKLKYDCPCRTENTKSRYGKCSYEECAGPHRVNFCSKSKGESCRWNQECKPRKYQDAKRTDEIRKSFFRGDRKPECSFCVEELAYAIRKSLQWKCVSNSTFEGKRCF